MWRYVRALLVTGTVQMFTYMKHAAVSLASVHQVSSYAISVHQLLMEGESVCVFSMMYWTLINAIINTY